MGNVKSSMSMEEFKRRAAFITAEKKGTVVVDGPIVEGGGTKGFNYDRLSLYGQSTDDFKLAMMEATYEESGSTIGFSFMSSEFLLAEKKSRNLVKKADFMFAGSKFDGIKWNDISDEIKVLIMEQNIDNKKNVSGYANTANGGITVALQQWVSYYNEEGILVEFWMNMKKMPYGMTKPAGFEFKINMEPSDLVITDDNNSSLNVLAIQEHASVAGIVLDNSCYRAVCWGGKVSDLVDPIITEVVEMINEDGFITKGSEQLEFNDNLVEYSSGVMIVAANSYSDKDNMAIDLRKDSEEIMYGKAGNLSSYTCVNISCWNEKNAILKEDKAATDFAKRDGIDTRARKLSSSWDKEDFLIKHDAVVEFIETLAEVDVNLGIKAILHTDMDKNLIIKVARYMRDLKRAALDINVYNYAVRLAKANAGDSSEILALIDGINNSKDGVLDQVLNDKGLAARLINVIEAAPKTIVKVEKEVVIGRSIKDGEAYDLCETKTVKVDMSVRINDISNYRAIKKVSMSA